MRHSSPLGGGDAEGSGGARQKSCRLATTMKNFYILTSLLFCFLGFNSNAPAKADVDKIEIPLRFILEDKTDVDSNAKGQLKLDVTLLNSSTDQVRIKVLDEKLPFTVKIFNSQGDIVNREILRLRSSNEGGELTDIILNGDEKKVFSFVYPDVNNVTYKKLPVGTYEMSIICPIAGLWRNEEKIALPDNISLLKSDLIEISIDDVQKAEN